MMVTNLSLRKFWILEKGALSSMKKMLIATSDHNMLMN